MNRKYQVELNSGSVVFSGSYHECLVRHWRIEHDSRSYAYIREVAEDTTEKAVK